jgi:hypothetical protein
MSDDAAQGIAAAVLAAKPHRTAVTEDDDCPALILNPDDAVFLSRKTVDAFLTRNEPLRMAAKQELATVMRDVCKWEDTDVLHVRVVHASATTSGVPIIIRNDSSLQEMRLVIFSQTCAMYTLNKPQDLACLDAPIPFLLEAVDSF